MKRLLLLLGALCICVSGCVTSPVPPGLTSVERSQLRYSEQIGSLPHGGEGKALGLPRGVVRFLATEAEGAGNLSCGETAPWPASVDGVVTVSIGADGSVQVSALDNDSACQTSFEIEPEQLQLFSSAELDAIYDYYRDWLIPCIAIHGYSVRDEPVSRTEFVTLAGDVPWSPYWSVDFSRAAPTAIDDLYAECPMLPEFALR